ncbi:hypothetical protein COLO4_18447 [Corchorus olitorius]|uniref:Uncharacterized protein n=1 Tax=Corchorus olitorius TaxID=93759 RepID=A0A1R3J8Z8_9ROSI|nr:hypothetical protein COLO4_18447 [Corchorus olitorius]
MAVCGEEEDQKMLKRSERDDRDQTVGSNMYFVNDGKSGVGPVKNGGYRFCV